MSRANRQERLAQLKQQHREQFLALPDSQRGVLIIGLLLNAMVTLLLQAVFTIVLVRCARRTWQHRGEGPVGAVQAGASPGLVAAVVAMVAHWLATRYALNAASTGRAMLWLARIDQWIDQQQDHGG